MPSPLRSFRALPHRHAFNLAWPMILANISTPLVAVVDTAMLGNFSTAAHIGAAAVGGMVVTAVYWIFAFIRLGTTSLVGRALGAGSNSAAMLQVQRAAALALAISGVILLLQWIILPLLMPVLVPDGHIQQLALSYAQIRIHSLPAVMLTWVAVGFFIGAQDTRRPLAIAVVVNVINVALNIWFVAGLQWGSQGSATATLIAEWCGVAFAIILFWRYLTPAQQESVTQFSRAQILHGWRALTRMNADLFLRTLALYVIFMSMTSLGSRMGETILAANAILLQITLLAAYGLDGYAHAVEAMTARAIGRRRVAELREAVRASAVAALVIASLITAALFWGQSTIVAVMTRLPDVAAATDRYYWFAALLPLLSTAAYLFDGVFIGAGATKPMRNTVFLSIGGVYLPMLLLSYWWHDAWVNTWLWLSYLAVNVARGVFLGAVYWRLTRNNLWLAEVSGQP